METHMIFETHAHYDDEAFEQDREALLNSMEAHGIGHIVNACASIESLKATEELMEKYPFVYGAFGIHPDDAEKMGLYLGIGGVVTFKNAKKLKEVVEYAPLEQLVLETDSPYLSPEPNRGKRNSSLNLPYVAAMIAELKGISGEEVIAVTEENAKRLLFRK